MVAIVICFMVFALNFEDGLRIIGRVFADALKNFFLPQILSKSYLEYAKWKFLHQIFCFVLRVLNI